MPEAVDLSALAENPSYRRVWLLLKALGSEPFDRAIELARAADDFITGQSDAHLFNGLPEAVADAASRSACAPEQSVLLTAAAVTPTEPSAPARAQLSADLREKLVERLAAGAGNAELAAEFGLSSKQVQGFRMGRAREISKRRDAATEHQAVQVVTSEEIIRYLRQQDDIVVPQGTDEYLVNGRFRLKFGELVGRANKMRERQGKPQFEVRIYHRSDQVAASNGHSAS